MPPDVANILTPSHDSAATQAVYPDDMELTPPSRRPIVLPEATVRTVTSRDIPVAASALNDSTPRVSIIIITYNNLLFTRMCLATVLGHTSDVSYEIIIVDNASNDGTREYLREIARRNPNVRVVLNEENRGFAAANNQGLTSARATVLVLLNNDVMVPSGWLARLAAHLDDSTVGCVGPVTNRIGNEAEIETDYHTYGQMLRFAESYTAAHRAQSFEIPTPCMFCLALRRDVLEQVGPLDERFEVGMLEDDDYAMRLRAAGFRSICAEDVFVHHFGQASFGQLFASGKYGELIEANRRRFEEKWGVAWQPYGRRTRDAYERLVHDLREMVDANVPAGALVSVVSKGDDELLRFSQAKGWHFPRAPDGTYSGHHPADSDQAIAQLRAIGRAGARYLVLPQTAMWWLERYPAFGQYLEHVGGVVARRQNVGVLYALEGGWVVG
jgi:GT2 family glycosyltransferase